MKFLGVNNVHLITVRFMYTCGHDDYVKSVTHLSHKISLKSILQSYTSYVLIIIDIVS